MRNTLLTTAAILGLTLGTTAFAQQPAADPTPPTGATTDQAPPAATAPTPDSAASAPGATTTEAPVPGSLKPIHKHMRHHPKPTTTDDTAPGSDDSSGSMGHQKFAHEPGTGESGPASMRASNIDGGDSHSDIAPHLPSPKAGHDASTEAYLGAAQRALKAHRTGEAQQALEMAETRVLDRSTPAAAGSQPTQDAQAMQISQARKALGRGDMKAAHEAIRMALAASPSGTSGAMTQQGMSPSSGETGMSPPSGEIGMSGGMASPHATNAAPTGAPTMAPSGAGPTPGASAGASAGGGPAGTGTVDSAGGAK